MTKSTLKPGRQRQWEQTLFAGTILLPTDIWRNVLNPDSLRLCKQAHVFLRFAKKINFYRFEVDSMTNMQLLQLDRLLTSPYYVDNRRCIELVGEEDAIMLQLHSNNLGQYLDNLTNA